MCARCCSSSSLSPLWSEARRCGLRGRAEWAICAIPVSLGAQLVTDIEGLDLAPIGRLTSRWKSSERSWTLTNLILVLMSHESILSLPRLGLSPVFPSYEVPSFITNSPLYKIRSNKYRPPLFCQKHRGMYTRSKPIVHWRLPKSSTSDLCHRPLQCCTLRTSWETWCTINPLK